MHRLRQHPAAWAALALFTLLTAALSVSVVHWVGCTLAGRDGWKIELPDYRGRTPADVRRAVRAQTWCVPVEERYVNLGYVPEGYLAETDGGGRVWVALGEPIRVWVEGSASQATDPCRPRGAYETRRNDCPGGVGVLPDARTRELHPLVDHPPNPAAR